MTKGRSIQLSAGVALTALSAAMGGMNSAAAQPVSIAPLAMARVGTVDERYQSYNVEMLEVGLAAIPYVTMAGRNANAPEVFPSCAAKKASQDGS